MASEEQTLSILVKARDLASRTIGKVNKSLDGIGKHAKRGVANAAANLKRLGMLGAGIAAGLGIGAIKFASDWESAAAGVRKTVDGNVEGILAGIVDLSNKIPVASEELAGIAEAAGALGVAKKDILTFTEVVAKLGVTTDLTSEAAATSLGHLRTTLGLSGKDFDRFGNTLVDLGNNGASTESQILGMAEQVAGAAKLVGLGKRETLGWASALANTGEQVEAGGSSLQRFFLKSFAAVNKGGKGLEAYARIAGMSGRSFQQTMKRDFSGAMERFIVGLGELSKPEQQRVLEDLGFTDIRITRALLKLTGNTRNLTDSLDTSEKAWKRNNAMTEEAEKRFDTFASRAQVLKNNLANIGATIGSAVLPGLSKVTRRISDWLADPEQQKNIERFSEDIAKVFEDLIADAEEFVGTIDWEGVLKTARDALSVGTQAVQKAFELFNSAPDWLKTAIVTGWGLNKLTGGAFGSIVGELGKGLIKGVLNMTAGTVNLTAGSVRGGAAAPAGARGSVVAGAVGGLLAVTIAAGSIYALAEAWKGVMEDVGFTQQEVDRQIQNFGVTGRGQARTEGARPGTEALKALHGEFRGFLETGNILLDVANKVASAVGAGTQTDNAILEAARQGLHRQDLTREQLEERLSAINQIQQLQADHQILSAEAAQKLNGIEQGIAARLANIHTATTTGNSAVRDVASAVRAQDLSVTTHVTVPVTTTISGRDTANTVTKLITRTQGVGVF